MLDFIHSILVEMGIIKTPKYTDATNNLIYAIDHQNVIIAKEAIENGADVNAVIPDGEDLIFFKPALTVAVKIGCAPMVELLLSKGAVFNPSDLYYYASPLCATTEEIKSILKSSINEKNMKEEENLPTGTENKTTECKQKPLGDSDTNDHSPNEGGPYSFDSPQILGSAENGYGDFVDYGKIPCVIS